MVAILLPNISKDFGIRTRILWVGGVGNYGPADGVGCVLGSQDADSWINTLRPRFAPENYDFSLRGGPYDPEYLFILLILNWIEN